MTPYRLAELRRHAELHRHCTSDMALELIDEVERLHRLESWWQQHEKRAAQEKPATPTKEPST